MFLKRPPRILLVKRVKTRSTSFELSTRASHQFFFSAGWLAGGVWVLRTIRCFILASTPIETVRVYSKERKAKHAETRFQRGQNS